MIKFKVYNCECECCYDSKKVDWIDAVIKPYTTYVGGYSGYQGYKVLNTLCKPCNYSVGSVVYALDTKQTYIKQTNSWVLVN